MVSEDKLSPKTLPAEQSSFSVDGDSLVVTALKKADWGDGIVMRFSEETRAAFRDRHTLSRQGAKPATRQSAGRTERIAFKTLRVEPYKIETVELAVPAR